MGYYYDRKGHPITQEEAFKLLFETPLDRRIALTTLPDGTMVSTVHLVFDHSLGKGPPVLFETMVWSEEEEAAVVRRYHTEEEARAGHEATVDRIRQRLWEVGEFE